MKKNKNLVIEELKQHILDFNRSLPDGPTKQKRKASWVEVKTVNKILENHRVTLSDLGLQYGINGNPSTNVLIKKIEVLEVNIDE